MLRGDNVKDDGGYKSRIHGARSISFANGSKIPGYNFQTPLAWLRPAMQHQPSHRSLRLLQNACPQVWTKRLPAQAKTEGVEPNEEPVVSPVAKPSRSPIHWIAVGRKSSKKHFSYQLGRRCQRGSVLASTEYHNCSCVHMWTTQRWLERQNTWDLRGQICEEKSTWRIRLLGCFKCVGVAPTETQKLISMLFKPQQRCSDESPPQT